MRQLKTIVFIISCSILFIHSKAYAGSYHPFVISDSVYWNVTDIDQSGGGGPGTFQSYLHVFLMAGDSSYNGKLCRKIFIVGNSKTDLTLIGFVRENNEQVFFKSVDTTKDTTEKMLYDYNLQPGDSFTISNFIPHSKQIATSRYGVIGTDTERIENGEYRKRILLETQNTPPGFCGGLTWFESIGDFNSTFYTAYTPCVFEHNVRVNCMTVNHVEVYGDPAYHCHTDAGINNMISQKNIRIYPDPARNYLRINNLSSNSGNFSFQVYNELGQIVKSETLTTDEKVIDISSLKSGVYFLQFANSDNGQLLRSRFVKE